MANGDGNYTDTDAWRNMGSMERIKYRQFRAEYIAKNPQGTPPLPGAWMKDPNRYKKQWRNQ